MERYVELLASIIPRQREVSCGIFSIAGTFNGKYPKQSIELKLLDKSRDISI